MTADRPRILCVDDEPWNLELLESILVPEGYEPVLARNGSEALETLRRQPIDVVLLDVMMPVMGGYEACRRIKADESLRNTPVVMITALKEKQDRIRGIEAGAEEYLSKPFDRDEVVARIRMLLRIKELNDRLSFAYANITSLTSYGEQILERMQPVRFELLSSVDVIVDQVLRKPGEGAGKPASMFVGLADSGPDWKWFRYDRVHGVLARSALPVDLHAGPVFPMPGREKTFFWNEGDPRDAFFTALFDRIGEIRIPVRNALCRLSGNLSIIALNYGRAITSYDASVLDSLLIQSLFFKSLSEQITETEGAFLYMVQALARSSEANDEDTGYHISRVGEYSAVLAERLAMPEEFVRTIRFQASLHDVGKVHTHPDILRKQGPLAPLEWEEMRRHPIVGANIVGHHPRLQLARAIALTHHERWDGSGYPYGLKGAEIPIEGRIASLADNYDALRSSRPYKAALDHATAFRILTEGNDRTNPGHYDPAVLAAFREVASRIEETYERMKDP
jgi:response regulator RpfG family c-di-GMP phosphodiesterase